MKKTVDFNLDKNITFNTYSHEEYDRGCIDHVLYRKAYKLISDDEFQAIYVALDLYKLYEMPIHRDSLKNNLYHIKKSFKFN
jgi:hypothetical protein